MGPVHCCFVVSTACTQMLNFIPIVCFTCRFYFFSTPFGVFGSKDMQRKTSLYCKGNSTNQKPMIMIMIFFQDSDDLSSFAKSVQLKAPYIVVCYSSEETTFHIIVEEEQIYEFSIFQTALLHLIGTYFVFDIAYPKPLYALLIMVQHYILSLHDAQRDPPSVFEMVTLLKRMDTAAQFCHTRVTAYCLIVSFLS